jgi:hypothetical protein
LALRAQQLQFQPHRGLALVEQQVLQAQQELLGQQDFWVRQELQAVRGRQEPQGWQAQQDF